MLEAKLYWNLKNNVCMGGLSANFCFNNLVIFHISILFVTLTYYTNLWVVHCTDHLTLNVSYVEGCLQVQPNMLGKKCTVKRKQFQIESYCHHEIELLLWVGSSRARLKYNYLVKALGRLFYIHSYFIYNFKSLTIHCEWQTTERGKAKANLLTTEIIADNPPYLAGRVPV